MPELPEVETICRQLQKHIAGQIIRSARVLYFKVVQELSVKKFEQTLAGKKIKNVGRQGKLILIRLSSNQTLVVHLKMSGRMLFVKKDILPAKSTAVVFNFKNGLQMFFDDFRRFGFMKIVPTSEESKFVHKQKLGIDFFDPQLTAKKFQELLSSRGNSQIKPLLMDQSLIAGIGNIYAQESCFSSKIHPLRKVNTLTDKNFIALYQALNKIMKLAIKRGGSSVDAGYVDAFNKPGKFAPLLKVYDRVGQLCLRCKIKLQKKSIGGRGTVFCPKCQK